MEKALGSAVEPTLRWSEDDPGRPDAEASGEPRREQCGIAY
jgi:hypothetical protein